MTEKLKEQLAQIESEITAKMNERRELLKSSVGETVENYTFKTNENAEAALSDLFGDKGELILIHNMGKGCTYCTLWVDGFNGVIDHLADRAAFVVVSPNSPEVQQEFSTSRGWKFSMASTEGSTFSRDMGYEVDYEGEAYQLPGYSVFKKDADGTITRVARDFFGPGDVYSSLWHLFYMLPNGPGDWQPKFSYEQG